MTKIGEIRHFLDKKRGATTKRVNRYLRRMQFRRTRKWPFSRLWLLDIFHEQTGKEGRKERKGKKKGKKGGKTRGKKESEKREKGQRETRNVVPRRTARPNPPKSTKQQKEGTHTGNHTETDEFLAIFPICLNLRLNPTPTENCAGVDRGSHRPIFYTRMENRVFPLHYGRKISATQKSSLFAQEKFFARSVLGAHWAWC